LGGILILPAKILRSLIHEKFPFELRVELELLSRQRSISNKEKQEELILLLKKHSIDDIVPLGSGTNRYAFKLCGFVVKFATDNDGKIDNLKEFKMAKVLYPHVTEIHEVSQNGTILVAEYIQPFDSFHEMCIYQDAIRKILSNLSSRFLIGDVGINQKNYANWGLRIGMKQPVCLDFAYVYEVSSALFLCNHCQTNSMLVPDKDFFELYCPNKTCGKKYKFEEIRARLGNDIHSHEIGDLSTIGYLLKESNVLNELDINKSSYLKKDIIKKKPKLR
jgi:hypothetical protein